MLKNLLSCIVAHFNVGALHVFNVGRMVLRNGRGRSWWTDDRGIRLRVGDFWTGKDLRMVKASEWRSLAPD